MMSSEAELQNGENASPTVDYWWVNQNPETYQAEKAGYYLFAPPKDKMGKERIQYKNMARLKPSDIIPALLGKPD